MNDICYYCQIEKIDGIDATTDEDIKGVYICLKHQERFERQIKNTSEQSLNK